MREDAIWRLVSYAPQDPTDYFFRSSLRGDLSAYRRNVRPDIESLLLDTFGLVSVLHKNPYDLDPVQRKKFSFVISARSCPRLLILDEPTQFQSYEDLKQVVSAIDIVRRTGTSILCITHDERLLNSCSFAKALNMSYYRPYTDLPMMSDPPTQELSSPTDARTRVGAYLMSSPSNRRRNIKTKIAALISSDWEDQFPAWSRAFLGILENWDRKVYPLLNVLLRAFAEYTVANGRKECRYVDLGCGNGWQTIYTTRMLQRYGLSVRTVGIDLNRASIDCARGLFRNEPAARFVRGDCTNKLETRNLYSSPQSAMADLATSYFVLHDTCDPAGMIAAATEIMSEGATIILAMVNPKWVEGRTASGDHIPIGFRTFEKNAASACASAWIGEFTIEDGGGGSVYVPYFHRGLDWYRNLLQQSSLQLSEVHWVCDNKIEGVRAKTGYSLSNWQTQVPSEAQSLVMMCRKMSS